VIHDFAARESPEEQPHGPERLRELEWRLRELMCD